MDNFIIKKIILLFSNTNKKTPILILYHYKQIGSQHIHVSMYYYIDVELWEDAININLWLLRYGYRIDLFYCRVVLFGPSGFSYSHRYLQWIIE